MRQGRYGGIDMGSDKLYLGSMIGLIFDSVHYWTAALQISTTIVHIVSIEHFRYFLWNSTPIRLLKWHPLSIEKLQYWFDWIKLCMHYLLVNYSTVYKYSFSIFLYLVCNRTFYCGINSHHSEWAVIMFTNLRHWSALQCKGKYEQVKRQQTGRSVGGDFKLYGVVCSGFLKAFSKSLRRCLLLH